MVSQNSPVPHAVIVENRELIDAVSISLTLTVLGDLGYTGELWKDTEPFSIESHIKSSCRSIDHTFSRHFTGFSFD